MRGRQKLQSVERALLRSTTLVRVLSRSRLARRAYLGLVSTAFSRESRAALAGIAKNRATEHETPAFQQSYYSLRRGVHRLEKGLIASPRRAVFAADYAPEMVATLAHAPEDWRKTDPQLFHWALAVLQDYFDVVDFQADPRLERAQLQFAALVHDVLPGQLADAAPFPAGERPALSVSYDDLHQLFRRRRSVRWFEPDPVPRALLDQALTAAAQAPSACNRQPYRFVIADQPADAQALGGLALGTAGFSQQFPCCLALVGELDAFTDLRDRHVIYVDGGLVAMSFVLACESLGLATCVINWPDLPQRDDMVRAHLGLSPYDQVIVLIAVGYAADDGGVPRSVKKDLSLLREYRPPRP